MTGFLLLSILPQLPAALAGNRVGNGGDAVVCRDSAKKLVRARLLDFDEGDVDPSSHPVAKAGAANADPHQLAREVLADLRAHHPGLHRHLERRIESMRSEIEFRDRIILKDLDDSLHLGDPSEPGCAIEQIAIRKSKITEGEKRFLIRRDLWEALSVPSRAGLLVHEAVYEYFFKLGDEDSRNARRFNARLFRGEFRAMKKEQYWRYIQEMRLPIYPEG